MLLIEFKKGEFISADKIDWIKIGDNKLEFTLTGDNECFYNVSDDFRNKFINAVNMENSGDKL